MGIRSSHYQHEKMKGRVKWNEDNLKEIEANKPVRKKIDEPKTPYPPMIEEDGSPSISPNNSAKNIGCAAHAEALKNALNKLAQSENHNSPFGEWTSSDDEEGETGDKDQGLAKQSDAVSFEERRRAHYEFKKVKLEQQEKAYFLDDELDNGIHYSGSCSTLSSDAREIDIEDSDEILQIIEIEENDNLSFP